MSIYVYEQYVALEDEKTVLIGDSGFFETGFTKPGDLFRACQEEYGRCVSRIYHDDVSHPIGWVFQRKARYEDTSGEYVAETWVELHKSKPTYTTQYHYFEME